MQASATAEKRDTARERARIRFVAGLSDHASLIAAIEKAGFHARVADDRSREEDKARKLAAYRAELRRGMAQAVAAVRERLAKAAVVCQEPAAVAALSRLEAGP